MRSIITSIAHPQAKIEVKGVVAAWEGVAKPSVLPGSLASFAPAFRGRFFTERTQFAPVFPVFF
jgi:hypothetical protein